MFDLTCRLPDSVEVNGQSRKINSDFRTGLRLCMLLEDDDTPGELKPFLALRLYFPQIPEDVNAALNAVMKFFLCGNKSSSGGEAVFSFVHDAGYIYSAFLQQYGIDLFTAQLHWWQFNQLFVSLGDDCMFSKIVSWRQSSIDEAMSEEQKRFLIKMKRLFALPKAKAHNSELENVLMGGGVCGDISL